MNYHYLLIPNTVPESRGILRVHHEPPGRPGSVTLIEYNAYEI